VKRPLRHLCLSIVLPVLFAATCACTTAAAGTATVASAVAPRPASPDAALQAFAEAIGVTCEHKDGRLACIGGKPEVGDYYDVDLHPGCSDTGWFGDVVASDGAELRDRIAPNDQRTTGHLGKGQLLCIEAIGWAGTHASYYYVREVPLQSIAICREGKACDGDRQRARTSTGSPDSCGIRPDGSPTKVCVAGWVRAEGVTRISGHR